MTESKKEKAAASDRLHADDAPELTDEFFERAEHTLGGIVIRHGQPRIEWSKQAGSTTKRSDPPRR